MSIADRDTHTVLLLTAANVLYVGESDIFIYWSRITRHNAGEEEEQSVKDAGCERSVVGEDMSILLWNGAKLVTSD